MRTLTLALILLVSGFSVAASNDKTNAIVQNFAHTKGLQYVPALSRQGNETVLNYQPAGKCSGASCSGLLVTYKRVTEQSECIDTVGLFGDLPLSVNNRPALFTMPSVSDNSSQMRDYLTVLDGNICYSLTYGKKGNGFNDMVALAKKLLRGK
ncbi:hypothetical protein [Neisseria montereyensis]|uniref:Uncharacterized protein n=1 Tax=Neisseria montereyensis TaxID=2973938 RepID=A0ABT2FD42_9NEIS|nr:hypothetical protein [Neisseria montereyensis]MCS4534025.1 hypothetical protein [Neisseria montereyensis]